MLDAVALQMCLAKLTPTEEELDDPQQRYLWCNRVLAIRAPLETMLHKPMKQAQRDAQNNCYGNKTVAVLRNCRSVFQFQIF